jgi:hypothetical protein
MAASDYIGAVERQWGVLTKKFWSTFGSAAEQIRSQPSGPPHFPICSAFRNLLNCFCYNLVIAEPVHRMARGVPTIYLR